MIKYNHNSEWLYHYHRALDNGLSEERAEAYANKLMGDEEITEKNENKPLQTRQTVI